MPLPEFDSSTTPLTEAELDAHYLLGTGPFDIATNTLAVDEALYWSCIYGHSLLVQHLLSGLRIPSPTHSDAQPSFITLKPASPSMIHGSHAETALHAAARNGHQNCVSILLSFGIPSLHAKQTQTGQTPLHLAAARGHVDVTGKLLGAGAEVDARDVEGNTPLIAAAAGGWRAVVTMLLEAGANDMARNERGWNAINRAEKRGWEEVLRIFADRDKATVNTWDGIST